MECYELSYKENQKQASLQLIEGNVKISDPKQIGNAFSNHFAKAGLAVQEICVNFSGVKSIENSLLLGTVTEVEI